MRYHPAIALALLGVLVAACAELEGQVPLTPVTVAASASPSPSASVRATQRPAVIPQPPEPVLQPMATPGAVATPAPAGVTAISTPTPRPTASPSACPGGRAVQVLPSHSGPGGLVYLLGSGFTAETRVLAGTRQLAIEQRSATRLVARIPADFTISETPHPVRVQGCEAITVGELTVNLPAVTGTVAQRGLLAQRFVLPSNLRRFPDDTQPRFGLQTFIAGALDTPRRASTTGEAFGVSLFGRLNVPIAGITKFRTLADDGVRILIDNQLVIDQPESDTFPEKSALVSLTAGLHTFRLDFFQATTPELGLDVFWTLPNSLEGRLPPEALVMPENPFLALP